MFYTFLRNRTIVIGAILLLLSVTSLIVTRVQTTSKAIAATGSPTSLKMLSTTFSPTDIPSDGVTPPRILEKIPFTLQTNGQVQVTALLDIYIGTPGDFQYGGVFAKISCTLYLDKTQLFTIQHDFYNLPIDRSMGLTTTSTVNAGRHTLSLQCVGATDQSHYIYASSEGMSAIITSP